MIKKTLTYEDYNGKEVTEDFYFHLSKAELVEMQLSEKDGFAAMLERIIKENDGKELVQNFKSILLMSYGRRSEDGRRFIKTEELTQEFQQTEAYSQLFVELATNAEAAAEFINGLVPSDMAPANTKTVELPTTAPVLEGDEEKLEDQRPKWIVENREPTKQEISAMSREELQLAMQLKESRRS